MFKYLVDNTVLDGQQTAGYAYIFHKMIHPYYGLIIEGTRHKMVIAYINNKYPIKLSITKFPKVNPASKKPIFTKAYNDYLKALEEIPKSSTTPKMV